MKVRYTPSTDPAYSVNEGADLIERIMAILDAISHNDSEAAKDARARAEEIVDFAIKVFNRA